jgi:HrpA-like RNA helicase
VAKERGESVGKVVGYSIHANRSTSRLTRLTFCTTGILIRRLMVDPELASVTHVIIDEVHERGLEVRTLDSLFEGFNGSYLRPQNYVL